MTWIHSIRDFLNDAFDGLSKVCGKSVGTSSDTDSTPERPSPPVTPPW
jgi:hypothetical protein